MRTTVFMLDEFRTSKMCPGGCGSVMEDVEGEEGYWNPTNHFVAEFSPGWEVSMERDV